MEHSKRSSTSEFLKSVVKASKSDRVTIDELKTSTNDENESWLAKRRFSI